MNKNKTPAGSCIEIGLLCPFNELTAFFLNSLFRKNLTSDLKCFVPKRASEIKFVSNRNVLIICPSRFNVMSFTRCNLIACL